MAKTAGERLIEAAKEMARMTPKELRESYLPAYWVIREPKNGMFMTGFDPMDGVAEMSRYRKEALTFDTREAALDYMMDNGVPKDIWTPECYF